MSAFGPITPDVVPAPRVFACSLDHQLSSLSFISTSSFLRVLATFPSRPFHSPSNALSGIERRGWHLSKSATLEWKTSTMFLMRAQRAVAARRAWLSGVCWSRQAQACLATLQADQKSDRKLKSVSFFAPGESGAAGRAREQLRLEVFGQRSNRSMRLEEDIVAGKVSAVQLLDSATAKNTMDYETLRACLRGQWRRVAEIPRAKRSQTPKTDSIGLGRAAFTWVWQDEKLWVPILCKDEYLAQCLCYFGVLDGIQHLLVDWLVVHAESADSECMKLTSRPHAWRGFLLRAIISALFSHDSANSADAALRCFFTIEEQRKASLSSAGKHEIPPVTFRLTAATVKIICELVRGHCPNTDPALYDRFATFYQDYNGDRAEVRPLRLAALSLYHPTRPSATATVDFMRSQLSHADDAGLLHFRQHHLSVLADRELPRFFTRLKNLSDEGDSKWVWEQYQRLWSLKQSSLKDESTPQFANAAISFKPLSIRKIRC